MNVERLEATWSCNQLAGKDGGKKNRFGIGETDAWMRGHANNQDMLETPVKCLHFIDRLDVALPRVLVHKCLVL